jgi:Smg protein
MSAAKYLGYIQAMFEVLAFVYENYWNGDACPELDHLERKLNAVGFEPDEIEDALAWLNGLNGLNLAAHGTPIALTAPVATPAQASAWAQGLLAQGVAQSPGSMRVYSIAEQDHLGAECLGFVAFLEASQVLPTPMREIVLDRAMAAPGGPLALDDLKIIVLMVYWSFGEEPDALVLDELCDDSSHRVAH